MLAQDVPTGTVVHGGCTSRQRFRFKVAPIPPRLKVAARVCKAWGYLRSIETITITTMRDTRAIVPDERKRYLEPDASQFLTANNAASFYLEHDCPVCSRKTAHVVNTGNARTTAAQGAVAADAND